MKIGGKHYTSIWYDESDSKVYYIDQTRLPHELVVRELATIEDAIRAIRDMEVRGAPLIGVTAAFGLALARGFSPRRGFEGGSSVTPGFNPGVMAGPSVTPGFNPGVMAGPSVTPGFNPGAVEDLLNARPTAINLRWAVETMLQPVTCNPQPATSLSLALAIREQELLSSRAIGEQGCRLLEEVYHRTGRTVQVMTHCNAGWLACVDWGTALAPVYVAQERGIPVHVWVSETRPRNQGADLTMFELQEQGVACTLIVDNAAGIVMERGEVDLVIVGADRIAANGDVANKVGTSLKAFAARHYGIPFWVAVPTSSFDKTLPTGKQIPIEERSKEEVILNLNPKTVNRYPVECVFNPGFDITPAEYVTGFLTGEES